MSTARIQEGLSNVSKTISQTLTNAEQSISQGVQSVSSSVQQFGSQTSTGITNTDFLDTNSIIANTVFILLLLVVFMLLLKAFTNLIGYFSQPNQNPYLIYGMLDGSVKTTVSRNPNDKDYMALPRSNNQNSGIEFTWTFWLNLNVTNVAAANTIQYMNVFNVGNNTYNQLGIATVNNAPGVYLVQMPIEPNASNSHYGNMNLHIIMDSEFIGDEDNANTSIDITNVPYNKWFHVAIRVQNMSMDVYINGTVTQRLVFQNVPKQNYGDIFICQNGGFDGYLSNLQYHARAMNVFDINSQVLWGPNTTAANISGNTLDKLSSYDYISSSWYFNKIGPIQG
jgi:hypothetical protein